MPSARSFLAGTVLCGACLGMDVPAADRIAGTAIAPGPVPAREAASMPPLGGAVAWLNAQPLAAADLRGKVVLVDFWTYTCVNWQRTLPYVRAWADKYRGQGLVVVGVHTPEFSFEHDLERVRHMTAQLQVTYPVAVDSERAVWRAFGNQYWPALYLVDAQGKLRHTQFGEGGYEAIERAIQQLLAEAGAQQVDTSLVQVQGQGQGAQAAADWAHLKSPETYLGRQQADSFAGPGPLSPGRKLRTAPPRPAVNTWGLAGDWSVGPEAITLEAPGGRIVHRFHARDVNLVMGPGADGKPLPFRIRLDGKAPGVAHGADVDEQGRGVLVEHRLYQLVRQPGAIGDRQFEIEFDAPGAQAFAFTFG